MVQKTQRESCGGGGREDQIGSSPTYGSRYNWVGDNYVAAEETVVNGGASSRRPSNHSTLKTVPAVKMLRLWVTARNNEERRNPREERGPKQ
jgi:hypothetical protein